MTSVVFASVLAPVLFAAIPNSSAYVQRGLVMHWDAIDNVGVGQHDVSATTWKDLTGNGFDWTLNTADSDASYKWNDASISFDGTKTGSDKTPVGMMSGKSGSDLKGKVRTIEFIYKAKDARNSILFNTGLLTGGTTGNATAYLHTLEKSVSTSVADFFMGVFYRKGVYIKTGDVNVYQAIYKGTDYPTDLERIYLNGAEASIAAVGDQYGLSSKLNLGNRSNGTSRPAGGDLMSIRIYSCPLTAEEMALNYAVDRVRFFGDDPADVVPAGYAVAADGGFVKLPRRVVGSVFDDAKVWYKGSAGNEVGTQDASNYQTCLMRNMPTQKSGGTPFDGGSYYWWGWRMRYRNESVKMPYAGVDLGESPCFVYPGTVNTTNEWVDVKIGDEIVSRPVIQHRIGNLTLPTWLPDWPTGVACSNYTCVLRFKPGEPMNPVNNGASCVALVSLGGRWENNVDAGVVLSLLPPDYKSSEYQLRWSVGQQFDYFTDCPIKKDHWVDLAVVVDSPKVSILMCCDMGTTNAFKSWTKDFKTLNAKPAIAASNRTFYLGSKGKEVMTQTITNGVAYAGLNAEFCGVFHQAAFWDRTLSMDEVKAAMGRPALVNVGITGNALNGEFAAKKTSVAAEGDWENLNPVLTESNPSATITFGCTEQLSGLPQFLRVTACTDSKAGLLSAVVNGTPVGELAIEPGKASSLYVGKDVIQEGANTLVLTGVSGEALRLDAVTLNGSWQYGFDGKDKSGSSGINYFGYDKNSVDGYGFNPAGGNDKFHYRGLGSGSSYEFSFWVPEDLVGSCKGVLRFRAQNTGTQTPEAVLDDISVNGVALASMSMKGGNSYDVAVPSRVLKSGWNKATIRQTKGWVNFDGHRFTIRPHVDGTFILLR